MRLRREDEATLAQSGVLRGGKLLGRPLSPEGKRRHSEPV